MRAEPPDPENKRGVFTPSPAVFIGILLVLLAALAMVLLIVHPRDTGSCNTVTIEGRSYVKCSDGY